MTPCDHLPIPTSTPRTGAEGGAAPACDELAAAYARLCEAIRASAARGDAAEENRLRNRAQGVLGRMCRLHCPAPDIAELEP